MTSRALLSTLPITRAAWSALVSLSLSLGVLAPAWAHARPAEACKLFTAADAARITGHPMKPGSEFTQEAHHGVCVYGMGSGEGMVSVAVGRESSRTAAEAFLAEWKENADGELKPVPGIGDEAFLFAQPGYRNDVVVSLMFRKGADVVLLTSGSKDEAATTRALQDACKRLAARL